MENKEKTLEWLKRQLVKVAEVLLVLDNETEDDENHGQYSDLKRAIDDFLIDELGK